LLMKKVLWFAGMVDVLKDNWQAGAWISSRRACKSVDTGRQIPEIQECSLSNYVNSRLRKKYA
jgi:hypothetical protein